MYKQFKIPNKLLLSLIILFIGIFSIFWIAINHYFKMRMNDVMNAKSVYVKSQINLLTNSNRNIAYAVYHDLVKDPVVLNIFQKLQFEKTSKNELREHLYMHVKDKYDTLIKIGVSQMQFVTSDMNSFLRMHKPEQFDDDLIGVRPSFKTLKERKKPIECFAIERSEYGYRYEFPLLDTDGRFLGALEITFHLGYSTYLLDKETNSHTHILINKGVSDTQLWKDLTNANPSIEDKKNYYYTKNLFETSYDANHDNIDDEYLEFVQLNKSEIINGLNRSIPFLVYRNIKHQTMSAIFIPYFDVQKDHVAWIVSFSASNPLIEDLMVSRILFTIGFLIVLALSMLYMYKTLMLNEILKKRVDVSSRKIKEKQELVNTIVDSANSIIAVIEPDGTMSLLNRFGQEFTGYFQEEVSSEPFFWSRFLNPEIRDKVHEIIAKANKGEIVKSFQNSWRTKTGEEHIFEWSNTLIQHEDGTMNYLFTIGIDITEHKIMEQSLIEAKEAAVAGAKAKSDFLANMSHEIRTPMNAIIGMNYLVLQSDLNDRQKNYVTKVQRSAELLLGIINDILDFSKIESGNLVLEHEPFILSDILDDVTAIVGLQAREKNIELTYDLDAVPLRYIGDSLRLKQVLLNLITNAIKFTQKDGQVQITVRSDFESESIIRLRFCVKDDGIGIDEERLDKLFKAFSQVDVSTTRKYGGTGLGLAISKNIVEMMNGRIWVESQIGVGSQFYFIVELQRHHLSENIEEGLMAMLGKLNVLLVDDNHAARNILAKMLVQVGFDVHESSNGKEALDAVIATKEKFDLILLDWKMPVMDGIEMVKEMIRTMNSSDIPPIILMTEQDNQAVEEIIENLPIFQVISKPLTIEDLHKAVIAERYSDKSKILNIKSKIVSTSQVDFQGLSVLLVEDNDLNQELAMDLLNSSGIMVQIANNGQEALDILEEESFDLILMDCHMPIMDGYEATRRIRSDARFQELPIIALTANALVDDQKGIYEAGMNEIVTKPINPHALVQVLAKYHDFQEKTDTNAIDVQSSKLPVLPQIEELDTRYGLITANGNITLYINLLKRFIMNYDSFKNEYLQLKGEETIRLVHTLKGSSGTIGASQLQNLAQRLERALQDNTDQKLIDSISEEIFVMLEHLIFKLKTWKETIDIQQDNERQDDALDITMALEKLEQFRKLLMEYDTTAIDLFYELKEVAGMKKFYQQINALENEMKDFEFEEAMNIAEELKKLIVKD